MRQKKNPVGSPAGWLKGQKRPAGGGQDRSASSSRTPRIIRKGKAAKPTEFGKLIKVQEGEGQIITHYKVYRGTFRGFRFVHPGAFESSPAHSDACLVGHRRRGILLRTSTRPAAHAMGGATRSVPPLTKSVAQLQRKRWFRKARSGATDCEGRISLLKRRHGLNRCRYKGQPGMERWVGLGVIGDNLINIGRALTAAAKGLKLPAFASPSTNTSTRRLSSTGGSPIIFLHDLPASGKSVLRRKVASRDESSPPTLRHNQNRSSPMRRDGLYCAIVVALIIACLTAASDRLAAARRLSK